MRKIDAIAPLSHERLFRKILREPECFFNGSGLGREEAGIKEAIKVKIKTDTAGVGHNQGDEFTFHWWDHVFNKAASSIDVENSEEGVSLKTTSDGSVSNKKTKRYDNKALLYGKFVKAATLTDGSYECHGNKMEEESEDEGEKVHNRVVSNEMLELCDGMTAHKAARHGHKLNGKLIRVQEQEKLLLESMKKSYKREFSKNTSSNEAYESDGDSHKKDERKAEQAEKEKISKTVTESKPKKKKERKTDTDAVTNSDSKRIRKKQDETDDRKRKKQDETESLISDDNDLKTSKKMKKNDKIQDETETVIDDNSELSTRKKKKKKHKNVEMEKVVSCSQKDKTKDKKRKKKKLKKEK